MHIAFLTGSFPAPSETFVLRQIEALLARGHEVDVFADPPDWSDVSCPKEVLLRTTYFDIPKVSGYYEQPVVPIWHNVWTPDGEKHFNAARVMRSTPIIVGNMLSNPLISLETLSARHYAYTARSLSAQYRLRTLRRAAKKFDLIHAQFGQIADRVRFVRTLFDAPLIVTFHGYDYTVWPRLHGPAVYHRLFSTADAVTVHSRFGARHLRALGCPEEKLLHLPVGIDVQSFSFRVRFARPGECIRVLTTARLVPYKGLVHGINAVAKLASEGYPVQYDIVGGGPLQQDLQTHIDANGLSNAVTLHGAMGPTSVRDLLSKAHLFLLPSTNHDGQEEGTPVSLMEAQASGLPVISTWTGGIPEIVKDGETGILVPPSDECALAKALRQLLHRPADWAVLGRAGRVSMEETFDCSRVDSQLEQIYENALQKHRGKSL